MEKPKKTIESYREQIDKTDTEILSLLAKRGRLAQKIGEIKKSSGSVIFDPSRERKIFERLVSLNQGPYNDASIRAIFSEIISATRALEYPIKVAFLGPIATFTHTAAVKQFGSSAEFIPQTDIATVFHEVEAGNADNGVVPVENTTEGVVNYTLDKFVDSELNICSEVIIPITHNLLTTEDEISKITKIYSHPQALAQCRRWIALNIPTAELKEVSSTAGAAQKVVNEPGAAAIASDFAAKMYNLNTLGHNIQDQTKNFTRFLVIGKQQAAKTGQDKTSVVFVAKDRVGVLYDLLKPLAIAKINLTKIESRPQKTKAWEYLFFVDLDGHISDRKVKKALDQLKEKCEFFRILGSYPKGGE